MLLYLLSSHYDFLICLHTNSWNLQHAMVKHFSREMENFVIYSKIREISLSLLRIYQSSNSADLALVPIRK